MKFLESQMTDVNGDIKNMDKEVNFLLDEQVLQDQRLVDLEGESEGVFCVITIRNVVAAK